MISAISDRFSTLSGGFQDTFPDIDVQHCHAGIHDWVAGGVQPGPSGSHTPISTSREPSMQQQPSHFPLTLVRVVASALIAIHGWHRMGSGKVDVI
jgi:hypothetical protein